MTIHTETWAGEPEELAQCQRASLPQLIRHLMERYHREGRVELAKLHTLAEQAALLEGGRFPLLLEIRTSVEAFVEELLAHFKAEEREVFPVIIALASGEVPYSNLDRVRLLEDEHQAAAGLLERLQTLTQGFQAPGEAGELAVRLYANMESLAENLSRHVYLENQILFRKALG